MSVGFSEQTNNESCHSVIYKGTITLYSNDERNPCNAAFSFTAFYGLPETSVFVSQVHKGENQISDKLICKLVRGQRWLMMCEVYDLTVECKWDLQRCQFSVKSWFHCAVSGVSCQLIFLWQTDEKQTHLSVSKTCFWYIYQLHLCTTLVFVFIWLK